LTQNNIKLPSDYTFNLFTDDNFASIAPINILVSLTLPSLYSSVIPLQKDLTMQCAASEYPAPSPVSYTPDCAVYTDELVF
jgi:hypothetical protein